jgi:hypothetical protein
VDLGVWEKNLNKPQQLLLGQAQWMSQLAWLCMGPKQNGKFKKEVTGVNS